jgi:hypothetical protein
MRPTSTYTGNCSHSHTPAITRLSPALMGSLAGLSSAVEVGVGVGAEEEAAALLSLPRLFLAPTRRPPPRRSPLPLPTVRPTSSTARTRSLSPTMGPTGSMSPSQGWRHIEPRRRLIPRHTTGRWGCMEAMAAAAPLPHLLPPRLIAPLSRPMRPRSPASTEEGPQVPPLKAQLPAPWANVRGTRSEGYLPSYRLRICAPPCSVQVCVSE